MIRNLQTRFILFIILIATFSGCFSLVLSYLFYGNSIENTMKQNQTKIAQNILLLHNETDFPLEKIISIDFTNEYELTVLDDISNYKTSDKTQNSNIIYCENSLFHEVTTIVKVENKYVVISNKPKNNLFFYIMINSLTAISSTLLFISIIITMFSKKFLMPIRSLNYATGEVSKGNFKIQLPIPNDFELGSLTAKFNVMVRELNSIETLRNDFISNVSHEIKTPIATIQGFSNLLKDDTLSKEEKDEYLDIIISETSRISNLTSNILKLTKLETQGIITDKTSFYLDEQLRHSVLILQRDLAQKNLDIDIDLDEVQIYSNEELLQQVWINLLSNAIKFTNDGGKISIQLMDTEDTATVKITDNGIGMKAESLNHIFDKFYQEDKSHSSNGNGLGLPLVKRIVDLCSGTIRVKSLLGEGSSFTVELPKNNIKIEKLKKYFGEFYEDKSATFDLGYSGRPELYLSVLCGKPIDTYFLNINQGEAIKYSQTAGYNLTTYFDAKPSVTGFAYESIISELAPSTIGYDFTGDVKPILEKSNKTYQERYVIGIIQNAAKQFVKDILEIFGDEYRKLHYQDYYISLPFLAYINSSKPIDMLVFNSIGFEDTVRLKEIKPITEEWLKERGYRNQREMNALINIGPAGVSNNSYLDYNNVVDLENHSKLVRLLFYALYDRPTFKRRMREIFKNHKGILKVGKAGYSAARGTKNAIYKGIHKIKGGK